MTQTNNRRGPSDRKSNNSRPKLRPANRSSRGGNNRKRKGMVSDLDPRQLIKSAQTKEDVSYESLMSFEDMPIDPRIKDRLKNKGFEKPTQIQEKSILHLLEGKDLVGIAQTGTGKTAAFLVPIIEHLLNGPDKQTALIVVPTRELALQVEVEFKSLTKGLKLYSGTFIGGTKIQKDMQKFRRHMNVIIGTPGRLLDLEKRHFLRLQDASTLVLDEFDRMLDMGFIHDVRYITDKMKHREQSMLFSATVERSQDKLIQEIVKDPVFVRVSSGEVSNDHIEQDIVIIKEGDDKYEKLLDILDDRSCRKAIVFDETKRRVDRLCRKLRKSGVKVDLIHGDKSQNYRVKALDKFKSGKADVLVATDVAARGIDVDNITHVINYQLPLSYDSYIHRIGRTGRAGNSGMAYTFVTEEQMGEKQ